MCICYSRIFIVQKCKESSCFDPDILPIMQLRWGYFKYLKNINKRYINKKDYELRYNV